MSKQMEKLKRVTSSRVFWIGSIICVLFVLLIDKFYELQIIQHEVYANDLRASVEKTVEIPAIRGSIYDRYGRPLATNKAINVLKLDQQVSLGKKDINSVLLDTINILIQQGDAYIDNVPLSTTPPFTFTKGESGISQFLYSIPYKDEEHRQQLLSYSAEELFAYLRGKQCFNLAETISDVDARKIIALRTEMAKLAYKQYKPVTIARDISNETIALIEENHTKYPGILVDTESIRYYPEGEILGNILGYTRTITNTQYDEMKNLGYDKDDVVGHEGIEKYQESLLRGEKGIERIEADDLGRKVNTLDKQNAVQGNDLFLTLDLSLQQLAYSSIENRLSEALITRLNEGDALTARDVLISMVENNQLPIEKMGEKPSYTKQYELYARLIKEYNLLDVLIRKDFTLKQLLLDWLKEDTTTVSDADLILCLHEEGALTLDKQIVRQLQSGEHVDSKAIVINQLQSGYLKPNQFAVDPCSASAVVIDVNTGETLAIVGYPSYDSNKMTTDFNNYYTMLFDGFDKRSMLWNRALMTTKAPGSTFKMISAIAGLEEGVINQETVVYDSGTFTKAGEPHPRCWVLSSTGEGHGDVDLTTALEVSCNYYFYELAYQLGIQSTLPYAGIESLTKYVQLFGLDRKTGIELAEASPNVSTPKNLVTTKVANIFDTLATLPSSKLEVYIKTNQYTLSQEGLKLPGLKLDSEETINTLLVDHMEKALQPVLNQPLYHKMDELVTGILDTSSVHLKEGKEIAINQVVTGTMNDASSISLKNKVRKQLYYFFVTLPNNPLEASLQGLLDTIDEDLLLDAYESAYRATYSTLLESQSNPTYIAQMKYYLERIDEDKDTYTTEICKALQDYLLTLLLDNILEKVNVSWNEGVTVRTAIGQGNNAFSPVQMGRYMASLANGKEVLDLSIIKGVNDYKQNGTYKETFSKTSTPLPISSTTIEQVHQGMLQVTTGENGTAHSVFKDFPVSVAGKTGTAEEGKHEHSWFVGFAPYDNPEVAIVTTIYNADGLSRYGTYIAKDILSGYFDQYNAVEAVTLNSTWID